MKPWSNRGPERKADPRLPSTPTLSPPPQVISPEAAKIVDSFVQQSKDLLEAQEEVRRLTQFGEEKDREIDFLKHKLEEAEYRAAFYQRHSVTLHTRLTDVAGDFEHILARIDHALKASKIEAEQTPHDSHPPTNELYTDDKKPSPLDSPHDEVDITLDEETRHRILDKLEKGGK